jgi:hypothetical protein
VAVQAPRQRLELGRDVCQRVLVRRYPKRSAVQTRTQILTYEALNRAAAEVQRRLAETRATCSGEESNA